MESISFAVALAIAAALGWSLLDLLRRFLAARVPALPLVALVTLGAVPPLVVWLALSGAHHADPGYLPLAAGSVTLNVAANFAYFRSLQLSPLSKFLQNWGLSEKDENAVVSASGSRSAIAFS